MSKTTSQGVHFPQGLRIESLDKTHKRRGFSLGQADVDGWLQALALQSQKKHLTVTKVLIDEAGSIVGFYTLSTAQVDFSDLPAEIARKLPRRQLPVAVIAWFGFDQQFQGRGLGRRLLATALHDCFDASQTFAFVAVILDCVDMAAKKFYQRFDFQKLPGYPMRLYLSANKLQSLMA